MNLKHVLAALAATLGLAASAGAQQTFRIGTGAPAGNYFPVGNLIAAQVSQPGRLVVSVQASNGSVANVNAVAAGAIESGFSQSDVASWAQQGIGLFAGRTALAQLRLIANLYPESVHLVVRKGAGIRSVSDLRGKRVAMDEPGSGTLVHARLILAAWGVRETELRPVYSKPAQAADRMKDGEVDAIFLVSGMPSAVVAELADGGPGIELVPIDGAPAEGLRMASGFFSRSEIPAGTYPGVAGVATLAVGAQWITRADVDADTVYQLTRALFAPTTQRALQAGHARGRFITPDNAVRNAGIPLHPGAERYYREVGLVKGQ